MKAIQFALGSVLFIAAFSSSSMAQLQRSFVSGLGSDSNPCSRTAPCRTFTQAISQTNLSGEVYVLDTAGYAAFTTTKPISIVAPPGVVAGISVFSGGIGITVNAGASDTVILRGLTVNSQGGGHGIVFNTGRTLHIENCVVNGFDGGSGVSSGNGSGVLEVKDSIMRGNDIGIRVLALSGQAVATIDQVRLEANHSHGLSAEEGAIVFVRNSIASDNGFNGFQSVSGDAIAVELNIEGCAAFSNGSAGIFARSFSTGVATVRVSNSTVMDNGTGLQNNGSPAVLLSRGNNTVEGNLNNTSGTIGSFTAR
jgi:hypothetical protein